MTKFASKTIVEYLNSKSQDHIAFIDEDQYSKDVQDKIDEGYELLAFEEVNGLSFDLLSFAKLDINSTADLKTKFTLLETDNSQCPNGDSDTYHVDDSEWGDDFGLKYSETNNHFYNDEISFFNGSFGADVYFEYLGINKTDPSYTIDIKDKWEGLNGDIFVGSNGSPVVYIEGKNIYSKLPIEVEGNSSNWKLMGNSISSEDINKSFNPNKLTCS